MRHLRLAGLLAVAFALCAPPVATARDAAANGDAVIAPADRVAGLTGGELLRESWFEVLSQPLVNPFRGHCLPLLGGKVLMPFPKFDPPTATCTMTAGTPLFSKFGSVCTSVETRSTDEAVQRACALKSDRAIRAMILTVDGQAVNLLQPRFELTSPQGAVTLPPDNFLGIPPQSVTFVAHAWGATITKLRPGLHTSTLDIVAPGFRVTFTVNVEVLSEDT